jgi:hypothetical protein
MEADYFDSVMKSSEDKCICANDMVYFLSQDLYGNAQRRCFINSPPPSGRVSVEPIPWFR